MRRLALVAMLLLGGCYYYESDKESLGAPCGNTDPMDPGRFAADPATGACYEFPSSCDVPKEWPPCMPTNAACMVDADCGPDLGCVNGACYPRGVAGCMADDNCPLTQNCDLSTATCVDNTGCAMDTDCPDGQFCDMITVGGDCDPNTPGCTMMPMAVGLCSRQPPAPPPAGCTTNADCSAEQICPAQYGGCSTGAMPNADGTCPSLCETVCYDDSGCLMGTRCNATEVCGMPGNGQDPGMPSPLPCAGWCVASM